MPPCTGAPDACDRTCHPHNAPLGMSVQLMPAVEWAFLKAGWAAALAIAVFAAQFAVALAVDVDNEASSREGDGVARSSSSACGLTATGGALSEPMLASAAPL